MVSQMDGLSQFQHTAAWRRLQPSKAPKPVIRIVSTHSRVEAAASSRLRYIVDKRVSTHSRVEAAAAGKQ